MTRAKSVPRDDLFVEAPLEVQQVEAPLLSPELPALNRFQRLDTLARIVGFMPVSRTEQVEAMGLESFTNSPYGAAKHLAEVARHQKKAGVEDVGRAPRKITRNYINYAKDAKNSAIALKQLQTELVKILNPELVLDRVFEPEQPGLLEFLRFFDLGLLRQTGDETVMDYDPQAVDYSKDNPEIVSYLKEAMSIWTVHQVRKKLPEAVADQSARFHFFVDRLVEISKYSPRDVSAVAHDGLDELYVRKRPEVTNNEQPQPA